MKLLLIIVGMLCLNLLNAQEYLKQGDACYNQKNYSCAYDNYMKGYEANLSAVKNILYFRIGYCLNNMKRYDEAKVWFRRALNEKTELDPTWSLAFAHYSTFKYDSAAIYYIRAYGLATTNEHKKSTSYYAGLSYFYNKNYFDANTQFKTALKFDSTDISTNTFLARSYYSLKNYPASETAFRKLLSLSKDSINISYAYKMIGESNYAQRKYAMAIPDYNTALAYNPKDKQIIGYIGDCYLNMKKNDSAKITYQLAIDLTKKQQKQLFSDSIFIGEMNKGLLGVYANEKDTANAIKKLNEIMRYDIEQDGFTNLLDILVFKRKDLKTLESMFAPMVAAYKKYEMYPELAWLYNNTGLLYDYYKQQLKANSYYRLAVQANYPPTEYIGTALIKGLLKDKKYKEASDSINKWEVIPNAYPNLYKPFILNMKGRIAYAQNDTVTAAKHFKEAIKTSYASHDANLFVGKMLLDRNDSAGAFNYWSRITSSKNFGLEQDLEMQVYKFMGKQYFDNASKYSATALSSYTSASEIFDKMFAIDSNLALIRLYAGVTHLQLKRTYTGKSHLLKAADLYQKKKDTLAIVYRWLGFAELRGETIPNYTKAYEYYQKGIQANPSDSSIIHDLGTAYYQQKNYTKAAETFGKNTSIYKSITNKASAFYNKALSYYMNKQKAESLVEVNKALELNPQYADAKKLKTELEKPTQ